ncbi:unnamed protein product [Symbiodinium natans]|uniref:Uncharacterized protein n=1 Tax=Symbiodinium natans TaxID=878477 RepID=A0A812TQG6_9DINO|nr:unnamed protein product [Symbiodinium natans]
MRLAGENVELWSGQRLVMISRAKENRPLARFGATVATAPDCSAVLVMGGIEGHIIGGVCLNDVWRFDVDSRTWECLPEPSWQPRRGSLPVVVAGVGDTGCVLLVGGTGIDAKPLREVWKADAPMFRPTSWSQTTDEAMWPDAAYALWVPEFLGAGFLLVFDSAGSLWRSNDWGRSWLKLVQKLPFGWPHEQVSFVRYSSGALVAVTMSTRVWVSQDFGCSWTRGDGDRDPYHVGRDPTAGKGRVSWTGPPGLRCQIIDVLDTDASDVLVVARNRETCQLTLWLLAIKADAAQTLQSSWHCLVPQIHIYPGFSSVNQLVSAGRAALGVHDGVEMRAVFVEFNPINEFTVWRASPVGVDRHRAMLDRLGSSQTKVDHCTWQKHIIGALLPSMGKDWVPRDLAVSAATDSVPYQEDNEWTYWH